MLAAHVFHVVLGKFFRGHDKGPHFLNIVKVLLRHDQARNRGNRCIGHFVVALATRREKNVADHAVFAIGAAVIVDGLDQKGLRVGVIATLAAKFRFALAEFARRERRFGG